MSTSYYAISTEKVIAAGIDILLNSSPRSLLERGIQALEEGIKYEDIFGVEELEDSYFEIGLVSATREGPKFQLTVTPEKMLKVLSEDYLVVSGGREDWYTSNKFIEFLQELGYEGKFMKRTPQKGKRPRGNKHGI